MSPYIPEAERAGALHGPTDVGQLTYVLTQVCIDFLGAHMESYRHYAEVLGALACTHEEIYRLHVAPYEDAKRAANGDVTP
jgi:hypothetical protein